MKTIITDLDGTLLHDKRLSKYTIEVLKKLQKDNRLVLATGRNLHDVERIYKELEMDQYKSGALILLNGMSFYDFSDHEMITNKSFTLKESKFIIFISHLLLFRVTVVSEDIRISLDSLLDKTVNILRFIIKHKPLIKYEKKKLPESIQKLEISGTYFSKFMHKLLKIILFNYEIVKVNTYWIEILPKHTNKLNQVKYLINKYSLDINDLYVFGDGENDIEMLKYAVHSYAPVNAMNIAKQSAHFICDSCDHDGVAKILEEQILN